MERTTYYVQLHPTLTRISSVKPDDNTIQYTIKATPAEKLELEKRLDAAEHEDVTPSLVLERVHDEPKEDRAKSELNVETKKLFEKIYELGTPETKRFFQQQGIIST
ncbi:hypothetical protein [Bacillus piscicola]|uniref:hypothetical protein n=1 Tax=Bacillus piscicola TaxID=1632684 RepID=UPI001F08992A|nr:hypothetical protein [Bacillus piscicola]